MQGSVIIWGFKEVVLQMTQIRERLSQIKAVWTFEAVAGLPIIWVFKKVRLHLTIVENCFKIHRSILLIKN